MEFYHINTHTRSATQRHRFPVSKRSSPGKPISLTISAREYSIYISLTTIDDIVGP